MNGSMRRLISVLLILLLTITAMAQTAAIDSAAAMLKKRDFNAASSTLTAALRDSTRLSGQEKATAHCMLSEALLNGALLSRDKTMEREGISAQYMDVLAASFFHLRAAAVGEGDTKLKRLKDNQTLLLKRELMNAVNMNFQGLALQDKSLVQQQLLERNLLCTGYMLALDSTYQQGYNYMARTLMHKGDTVEANIILEKGLNSYLTTERREPEILALEMIVKLAKVQMKFLKQRALAKQTVEEGLALLDKEDELVTSNTGMTQMRKDQVLRTIEVVRKELKELSIQLEEGK
jgi:hypothetical protein